MLDSIGAVDTATPIVDIVHDCRLVEAELPPMPYDTICDLIITPTRVLRVEQPQKPTQGIFWALLEPDMLERIPPLRELKALQAAGDLSVSAP